MIDGDQWEDQDQDLGSLLSIGDLTVLSADGQPTMALRGILQLRSKYFRAMLDSDLKEANADTITLNQRRRRPSDSALPLLPANTIP